MDIFDEYFDEFEEDDTIDIDDVFNEIMEYCESDILDDDYFSEGVATIAAGHDLLTVLVGLAILTVTTATAAKLSVGATAKSKLENYYSKKDKNFIKLKDLEKKQYKINRLDVNGDFKNVLDRKGKELGKLGQFLHSSTLHVFYDGNTPVCAFVKMVSKDISWSIKITKMVYFMNPKYKKYSDYYIGVMALKYFLSGSGAEMLAKAAKEIDV